MIRRLRNVFSSVSDEELDAFVLEGVADVLTALGNVVDDEAVLAHIYAQAGVGMPDEPQAQVMLAALRPRCERIGILEAAITAAVKTGAAPSLLGAEYLTAARRYLFELRDGLQNRWMTAEDAFRLLTNTRHALHEADSILRRQRGMSLEQSILARIGDLQQLNTDLLGQLDAMR
jgi:hypothetical protein